jgi:hypothetical protein
VVGHGSSCHETAEPVAPANVGISPRRESGATGPAWLRFAFGKMRSVLAPSRMHRRFDSGSRMKILSLMPFSPRRLLTLVSAVTLAGWLSACSTSAPSGVNGPQSAWTLVTDAAGRFSVLLPSRPQESVKVHPSANGPAAESHEFIVDPDASIELGVIYNDFPESLPNIRAVGSPSFFDTVQESALKQLGAGRLIYATDGRFGAHPMRELRFELPDKKLMCQTRMIVVGHRMYQLIVVSAAGADVSRETDTLFNSFHFLYDDRR